MTPKHSELEIFEAIGRDLFGAQWQSDLARALGVSDRSVRQWIAAGKVPAPRWRALQDLCERKRKRLLLAQQAIGGVLGRPG